MLHKNFHYKETTIFFSCWYFNLINYFVEMLMVFDLLFVLNLHSGMWRLALMENPIICGSVTQLKLLLDFKHAALTLLNLEALNMYPM